MKAYKVCTPAIPQSDGPAIVHTRYAGTAADSKAQRDQLMEMTGTKKKDMVIEDCEIPTAKPDLLAFINNLLN